MTYLPPRACLVLMSDEVWTHVRFTAEPLPTWSDARTGEPVNLDEVVTWDELPERGDH